MSDPPKKRRRRRKTPLTREQILAGALDFADREGVQNLSMRKIAKTLHVEAMSLYNHVKNKDEILGGIVDMVVAEIALPSQEVHWKDAMRARALSAHAVLMKHPWAPLLLMSRVNVGPAMLRYTDATLGCLKEAGFTYAQVDYAWNTLDSFVYGFTLQKLNFPFEEDEFADAAEEYSPQLDPKRFPYLTGLSIEVMQGRHDGVVPIEFGVELILNSLETFLKQNKAS